MGNTWKIRSIFQACLWWLGIATANFIFSTPGLAIPLSPGDRLAVHIPGENYFARVYRVNLNGDIEVPLVGNVRAMGQEPFELETNLANLLIDQGYFSPGQLTLTIQIIRFAPINVSVKGELFQPGSVVLNRVNADARLPSATSADTLHVTGEPPASRFLTDALSAAGGVLPTAKVKEIRLIRQGQEQIIDLSGIFSGQKVKNPPLISGDQIIVPAAPFQADLVRPSAITPPGMKVFVSNLTVPALNNASSSVDNREEGITFPYGARFSQAVIANNCAGGTQVTNANRHAILVRTNRLTGETTYLDRPVEDLLRKSTEEDHNPLLMPRDGVACYDSRVTNIRDVFRTIGDVLTPVLRLIN